MTFVTNDLFQSMAACRSFRVAQRHKQALGTENLTFCGCAADIGLGHSDMYHWMLLRISLPPSSMTTAKLCFAVDRRIVQSASHESS